MGQVVSRGIRAGEENEAFLERMLKLGRYNNQSEVVREARRRMEREESSYLNPPPLTQEQLREICASNQKTERQERIGSRATLKSIRAATRKHRSIEDL